MGLGLDMAEVGRHSGSAHDVVEGQLADGAALLQQQRHGLAYAARRAQHGHAVPALSRGRREERGGGR